MKRERPAVLYLFREEEERKAETWIQTAAADYCSRCDISGPEHFLVERSERGKPFFVNCPQVRFSISHSGNYWGCVLAEEEIGVDLQEHVTNRGETREEAAVRFRKMARRFFHPLEAEFVEQNSYENFFDVWSARESYVKFTGQGIDREFSEHCVVPAERDVWPEITGTAEQAVWQAQGVWFDRRRYRGNYSLCICTENRKTVIVVEMAE